DMHVFVGCNSHMIALRPEPDWPAPGDHFRGLQIKSELGRGAIARVYLATQPSVGNRPVVLKLSEHGAAEADTLGRVSHPNIVPVYALEQDPPTNLTGVCMPSRGCTTLADVLDRAYSRPGAPRRAGIILEAVESDEQLLRWREGTEPIPMPAFAEPPAV